MPAIGQHSGRSVPQRNVLEGTAVSYTNSTMASGSMVMHQSQQATAVLMHWFFFSFPIIYSSFIIFFFQKIYKLPWQPYISTLIDMCSFHSTGRKSTYRALIGGFKGWKTGVSWSVFPENSYNENSSVNLLGYCWIYRMFMIAQTTGYIAVQLIIIRKTKYAIQGHEIM